MPDIAPACMIFAAGFGTRMKPLTQSTPKPLITVAGKPLVDHALELVFDAGCAPVVANLHYLAEQLEQHLANTPVQTIIETPQILDTGGGLRNALPLLGTAPVVTMNTDAVWAGPNPITALRAAWQPHSMDALLMCIPPSQAVGHKGKGDFLLREGGQLERGPGHIYAGVQMIKTDLLATIEAEVFSLNEIWEQMLKSKRLFGLPYPGHWCDVGHPQGIALAEDMLDAHDV